MLEGDVGMTAEINALKEAGDRHFRNQLFDLAISTYTTALEASEQTSTSDLLHVIYSNRSAAKLALHDYQGALADAQAALAIDDKWIKGWYRSAKALQGLGKTQRALQAAGQALQLEPGNRDVQALIRDLQRRDGPMPATSAAAAAVQAPTGTAASTASRPEQVHQPHTDFRQAETEQQQQQQQMRGTLDLQLLPAQLVVGSHYLPSPDGINSNLLLLLHGLGDRPAAFTALARRMQLPQTACLALSGPLDVPESGGGRSWFTAFDDTWELIQPRAGERRRLESLEATLQLLQRQLLPALVSFGGWQPGQVQLLGFSQGGTVALELARTCRGRNRLGGVVAVSASLLEETLDGCSSSSNHHCGISSSGGGGAACPPVMDAAAGGGGGAAAEEKAATDVLITHGGRDDVVLRGEVERTMKLLQQAGCRVELKSLPGKGHSMINSAAEMQACMTFWAARLRQRPTDAAYVEMPGRYTNAAAAAAAAAAATKVER